MQLCRVRSTVDGRDPHQDVFRAVFGVLDEDIEISVAIENAGIEEFIFHVVLGTASVRLYQIGVGIRCLRVLVEVLHVGVCRRAVEVEVILFHILAVIALAVGQSKEPFLENRILAVPQGQSKADFAPAVSARMGMIVGEVIPCVTHLAIVLADCAPLSLTQVGSPFSPWQSLNARLLKTRRLCTLIHRCCLPGLIRGAAALIKKSI